MAPTTIRPAIPALLLAAAVSAPAAAADPATLSPGAGAAAPAAVRDPLLAPGQELPAPDAPRISGRLSGRAETALEEAFGLAVSRLREHASCRAMFAEVGADGIVRLATTSYRASTPEMERSVCRRAVAFTVVGSPQTRLCRGFARLPARRAASDLLHEALHWAGLDEQPHDPDGLTPGQITRMVQQRCGL